MAKPKNKSSKQKQQNESRRDNVVKVVSRKQKRKDERKQKKQMKNMHYLKKRGVQEPLKAEVAPLKEANESNKEKNATLKSSKKDLVTKLKNDYQVQRKKMLIEANREEEENLKKLEKQLNLNKTRKKNKDKEKKLPKSFTEDGLSYILDACDGDKLSKFNLEDDDSDMDENLEGNIPDQSSDENSNVEQSDEEMSNDESDAESVEEDGNDSMEQEAEQGIEESFDSNLEEQENVENESEEDDISENASDDEEESDAEQDNKTENEFKDDQPKDETWEDIYGRKRDAGGNVIQSSTKYVPPALRNLQAKGDLARLEKQIKGQLNRLAESNMQSISKLIENLYARHSRNDMNQCLVKVLKSAIVIPNALTPERLVMEHAVFVALLHANVGDEVGATIAQNWIESMMNLYKDPKKHSDDKELDNYVMFGCYLYAFQVIACDLIFDLTEKFLANFSLKDIELIILVLRLVGFNMRKDDPTKLKNTIIDVQKKSEETAALNSRVRFMLETLMAIKNNNVKKMPNYDPEHQIHLTKIMRNFIRPGADLTPLKVRLEDLLNAESRGKWWIVGSAWSGRETR